MGNPANNKAHLGPPCESLPPEPELEYKARDQPAGIVNPCCRWDAEGTIEQDGEVEVAEDGAGVAADPVPERDREDGADEYRPDLGTVHCASGKETSGPN
jgi:hypothetical protein